jgi:hypothetical protein
MFYFVIEFEAALGEADTLNALDAVINDFPVLMAQHKSSKVLKHFKDMIEDKRRQIVVTSGQKRLKS